MGYGDSGPGEDGRGKHGAGWKEKRRSGREIQTSFIVFACKCSILDFGTTVLCSLCMYLHTQTCLPYATSKVGSNSLV